MSSSNEVGHTLARGGRLLVKPQPRPSARIAATLMLLAAFLVGIRAMSTGFQGLTSGIASGVFHDVSNPMVGLAVGLLATALLQSSSLSTSMIVALVAVPGAGLPVESAIPMVMGANIGTTVTNSLVALAYMGRKQEFRRAFATATAHAFFNLLLTLLLLPIEVMTGFLANVSRITAEALHGIGSGIRLSNPVGATVGSCVASIERVLISTMPQSWASSVLLVSSAACIYACLILLIRVVGVGTAGRIRTAVMRTLDGPRVQNVTIGAALTALVQSSSVTTSVLIPLAAARLIRLQHGLGLTLGANIGTTATALLAALAAPVQTATAAVQIALVHLFFNLIGVLLLLPKSPICDLPLTLSLRYAELAIRSRKLVLGHISLLYFAIPTLTILLSRALRA
jgi:solute carrier family 34 (sodium-dependent phosphate cotransporter)